MDKAKVYEQLCGDVIARCGFLLDIVPVPKNEKADAQEVRPRFTSGILLSASLSCRTLAQCWSWSFAGSLTIGSCSLHRVLSRD